MIDLRFMRENPFEVCSPQSFLGECLRELTWTIPFHRRKPVGLRSGGIGTVLLLLAVFCFCDRSLAQPPFLMDEDSSEATNLLPSPRAESTSQSRIPANVQPEYIHPPQQQSPRYSSYPPMIPDQGPMPKMSVDCQGGNCGTDNPFSTPFQSFGPGEYVGHPRTSHVPEYRLRVDDDLEFVFRVTRRETSHPYQINVGDEIRVESFTDEKLNKDLIVQPDGTITLRLLGQVRATGLSVEQLQKQIEELYKPYYRVPSISVTPLKVNTRLEDLRATVDSRFGFGGQARRAKVNPEGTVSLPAVGSVPAQGLTLEELKRELDERYAMEVEGIEVTPVLVQRAPRYIYVLGEVRTPGRYELHGPTTVMQAISMAGGWNVGANLWQVTVFRRGDDWRLLATMLNIRPPLYGRDSCPQGEIWLNDSDVVVIPKSRILQADNFIELVFTRGIYGVVPFQGVTFNFSRTGTL